MKRALSELQNEGFIQLLPPPQDWIKSKFPRRPSVQPGFEYKIRQDLSNVVFLPWSPVRRLRKPLIWIPDLQDIDLPEMFQKSEIRSRDRIRKHAIARGSQFYFSSNTMELRFREAYPKASIAGIVRFAFNEVPGEYSMSDRLSFDNSGAFGDSFFYAPNQFWKHKNHIVLIDAFARYRKLGGNRSLVLSGDLSDPRWPDYSKELEKIVARTSGVYSLGFIPRDLQLSLYNKCAAVIQPSLYEGWSSSIEEAIKFGKRIIGSDIAVIREQLGNLDGSYLFSPTDSKALSKILSDIPQCNYARSDDSSSVRWERFKSDLYQLVINYMD
jgi:glycosyltransferase involved in cell wall biosynthesis